LKKLKISLVLLIGTLIGLGAIIVGIANHPSVIQAIATKFAPTYNISYDSINGSLMDGVIINEVYHKDALIANRLKLKWNPLSLLEKKVVLHTLDIQDLNISALRQLLGEFKPNPNREKTPLQFDIVVKNGSVTVGKWLIGGVLIDSASLDVEKLVFNTKTRDFTNGTLNLEALSPLAKLNYQAQAKEKKIKGSGVLHATPYMWEKYRIPFETNTTVPIAVKEMTLSLFDINITLEATPRNIWRNIPQIDIKKVQSRLKYDIKERNLTKTLMLLYLPLSFKKLF